MTNKLEYFGSREDLRECLGMIRPPLSEEQITSLVGWLGDVYQLGFEAGVRYCSVNKKGDE